VIESFTRLYCWLWPTHDLAAHIDTAIRCGRAAYAVLHAIKTT
jgi:hypothetical protein